MSAKKIIFASLIIASLFWIIDSIVDFLVFSNYESFNMAFFSATPYEVYIRSLGSGFIVIPGIIAARMFSQRKRDEQALHLEHQRAEMYLESAGVIMVMVGPDEFITMVNDKTCQVLGYPREKLLESNWFELLVPEVERAHRRKLFHRIISGDITMDGRINTLVHSDGEMLLASFHNKTLTDVSGNVLGRLMSGEVITNSRLDNEALVRAEINFRNSVKDAPLPILINKEDEILFANNAMLQLFGYEHVEDFKLYSKEQRYTPESIVFMNDWWDRKRKGYKVFEESIHREIIRTDGEVRQIEVHNTPVLWGREEALETIYIDVTDQKMTLDALEQS